MDQLEQLEASGLEYNSSNNSYSDYDSSSSLGANISPPQSRSPSPNPSLDLSLSEPLTTSNTKHTIGARIQALTYLELGLPIFQIINKTGISKTRIYAIRKEALLRGWDPNISTIIEVYHVDDSTRSGRPKISQEVIDLILETVTKNSITRGWSCKRIAYEVTSKSSKYKVSTTTIWRTLKEHGYSSYKRTMKPGLKLEDKERRLKWCLDHEDWLLEDWKNVIWTDETSVKLGGVRGTRRIWRKPDEAYHPHIITRRWKGFSEFMWWSCFSYDKKGPYHIWKPETKEEREACKKDLEERNKLRYNEDKLNWELENGIRRLRATTTISGRKPQFKHDETTGAYIPKDGKGGINWYRYQELILKPKLIPFAKECLKERPKTLIQEDGAPSHASRYQQEVFDLYEVARLLWPPNSPDLNMIEPTWFWMKRDTTKRGPITSNKALENVWIKCWTDMP